MTAGSICSVGAAKGKFTPPAVTDCPVIPDPLVAQQAPAVGSCTYTNEKISSGTVSLAPGVYCGGLTITGGASVTLTPGEYIIDGGQLLVENGSSLTTVNAGIYLTGAGATLWFGPDCTINMTAPTSGPLAGLLVFEDRNAPTGQTHIIYSDNAPVLHGTIYLPQNELHVETNGPVSNASTFTIVIVRTLTLAKAANLYLNSNYNASNIPVPGGLDHSLPYLSQ